MLPVGVGPLLWPPHRLQQQQQPQRRRGSPMRRAAGQVPCRRRGAPPRRQRSRPRRRHGRRRWHHATPPQPRWQLRRGPPLGASTTPRTRRVAHQLCGRCDGGVVGRRRTAAAAGAGGVGPAPGAVVAGAQDRHAGGRTGVGCRGWYDPEWLPIRPAPGTTGPAPVPRPSGAPASCSWARRRRLCSRVGRAWCSGQARASRWWWWCKGCRASGNDDDAW